MTVVPVNKYLCIKWRLYFAHIVGFFVGCVCGHAYNINVYVYVGIDAYGLLQCNLQVFCIFTSLSQFDPAVVSMTTGISGSRLHCMQIHISYRYIHIHRVCALIIACQTGRCW
jgi:hypothetical protein